MPRLETYILRCRRDDPGLTTCLTGREVEEASHLEKSESFNTRLGWKSGWKYTKLFREQATIGVNRCSFYFLRTYWNHCEHEGWLISDTPDIQLIRLLIHDTVPLEHHESYIQSILSNMKSVFFSNPREFHNAIKSPTTFSPMNTAKTTSFTSLESW